MTRQSHVAYAFYMLNYQKEASFSDTLKPRKKSVFDVLDFRYNGPNAGAPVMDKMKKSFTF